MKKTTKKTKKLLLNNEKVRTLTPVKSDRLGDAAGGTSDVSLSGSGRSHHRTMGG